jgi:hypothetical protein
MKLKSVRSDKRGSAVDEMIRQAQNNAIEKLRALGDEYSSVLLLASYCSDNPKCTEYNPCKKCLKMCNIAIIKRKHVKIDNVICGYDFLDVFRK